MVSFEEGIPTYPWRMLFRTEPSPSILTAEVNASYSGGYVARFDGTNYTRAKVVSGSETDILIEFKDHGLQPGELRMEWDIMVQSDLFEDQNQRIVTPKLTPITLVESAGDEVDTTIIPILVPVIRGDQGEPFTYADFTVEQLAALTGPKGDKGESGEQGEPFVYSDFTASQLAALKGEKGEQGDQGEIGERGEAFTYEDFTASQLAALKGEKGDPGEKGDTGDPGERGAPFTYEDFTPEQIAALNQGEQGIPGEKGEQGEPGESGAAGEKGDPFTYEDFTPEQIAALKGEQGEQGDPGEKGDKGDSGDPGDSGADGLPFTYDDFTTEQLAALKGDKGDKGDQGEKGDPGDSGASDGLSNDHITIDNDKIYTLANKTARGNVFDGLVAFMRMTAFGQIEQCWINKALKKAGASGEPYIVWDPDDDRETSINFYNTELPDRVYILYWCTSNEYDLPNVYKTVGYQQIYGVRERGSSKGVWLIFDRDYYF